MNGGRAPDVLRLARGRMTPVETPHRLSGQRSRWYRSQAAGAAVTRVDQNAAVVRDFTAHDQRAVEHLVLAGLRERWGDIFDADHNQDLTDITGNYLATGAEVVVIEHDAGIVATGMLVPESLDRCRIVRMSVAASHRRCGLARTVVEELIRRARRRGFAEVHVSTDTPWVSAVELYHSCGFEMVDRDDIDTHFVMSLEST